MCAFFGVSRAAYYQWVQTRDRPEKDPLRRELVREAYETSRKTYGYRRIAIWIRRRKGVLINHKAVLRLMREMSLRPVARRRKVFRKMQELAVYHHYENILHRDFAAARPNQKWVTDITYFRTQQGWAYLSTIKDLFDGFIVAHQLGSDNSLSLVLRTLQQARQKVLSTPELILHSDQGRQYSSQAYFELTQTYGITASMSRRGNCWDNAPMESFFGHLKEEAFQHVRNPTFQQVRQIVDDYVHFYNYERIQLKTGQTPFEIRCLS
jgi:transposase InsO family protein